MAKPLALTPDALRVPQHTPQAATPARAHAHVVKAKGASEAKADQMPLQIRLPREEVRAIKVAAAESEQTISEFMLACFHAFMKSSKAG
jgi:methionine-rich copper-binding protein CopC